MKKRIMSLLLVCCMVFTLFPATVFAEDDEANSVANGSCGTDVTWALTENGDNTYTLTISGTGEMADYASGDSQPWKDYKVNITRVVIGDGVTHIGNRAFMGCGELENITIPESVTSYGTNAFHSCVKLTELHVGKNVTSIGQIGVYLDTAMTTLTVDEENTKYAGIGNWLYELNDDDTAYLWQVPAGAVKDEETVTVPDTISWNGKTYTIIGIGKSNSDCYTLSGAASMTAVNFSGHVEEMGANAFRSCTKLESIDLSGIKTIETAALANCESLKDITFAEDLMSIGEYAFQYTALTDIELPASVMHIGGFAFGTCKALKSVSIKSENLTIGRGAFDSNMKLKALDISAAKTLTLNEKNRDPLAINRYGAELLTCYVAGTTQRDELKDQFTDNTVCFAVTNGGTFKDGTVFAEGELATPVKAGYDFAGWFTSLNENGKGVGEAITEPGPGETYYAAWTESTILSGFCGEEGHEQDVQWTLDRTAGTLTISGNGRMCENFDNAYVEGSATGVMKTYGGEVKTITIDEGVSYLAANLTRNAKNVVVNIPASVTEMNIGTTTASAYSTFGNTYYSYDASSGTQDIQGISKINVAESNPAFKMENGVLFSKDGTVLYHYTDAAASDYTVPADVKVIAAKAFARTARLNTLKLNDGLETIGQDCFDKSGLSGSIVIPASVTGLGSSAFTQLPKLTEITILATDLTDFHALASNTSQPDTGITKVTFAEGTKEIPVQFCNNLKKLQTVILPESLEVLNARAFSGCEALTTVTLTKNTALTEIPDYAFYKCHLTSIVIPDSVTRIGSSAFELSSELERVEISPDSKLETIGNNAFCATAIKSLYLPKGVTAWGQYAFGGNRALTAVDLTSLTAPVTTGGSAFYNTRHGDPDLKDDNYAVRVYYMRDAEMKSCLGSNSSYSIYAVTNGGTFETLPAGNEALATPVRPDAKFMGWYTKDGTNDNWGDPVNTLKTGETYYAKWYQPATLTTNIGEQKFVVGTSTEFTFTTKANGDAGTMVVGTSDFSDASAIEKLEYYEVKDGNWYELKGDFGLASGFSMADTTSKFRVTFKKGGDYTFTASMKKAGTGEVLCSTEVNFSVAKATQDAPAAPTLKTSDYTSITLNAVKPNANGAAAQYSKDGGKTWQDSPEFTGLTAGTAYTFAVRYAETDAYAASDASTVAEFSTLRRSSGGSSSSSSTSNSVTVSSTKNGDVTVSPKNASKGTTVTITVDPDKGYELDTITVKDANGKTVKLTDKGNGKYTFTMPTSKVTVSAEFAKIQTASTFADVPADAYYTKAVEWAVKNGITNGKGNGLFGSNDPCTRGQIVTFLWRAAGSPAPKGTAVVPADVVPGSYCYDAVAWALENGITNGLADGTFGVNNTCTRGQSVTFLYRAVGKAPSTISGFTDVAADSFCADAVAWAVENGVTNGTSATTFSPNNGCTRAQIVTFIYRQYNK